MEQALALEDVEVRQRGRRAHGVQARGVAVRDRAVRGGAPASTSQTRSETMAAETGK
jgi:hypothetical protein